MDYAEAKELAEKIKTDLAPFCDRIEIAGSIRRLKKTDIKDVEIVCIAKQESVKDLFGVEVGVHSLLEKSFPAILKTWDVEKVIRNGVVWKTVQFRSGGKLDLFSVRADTWGTNIAIRTGPADYSKWLVTEKRKGGALPSYADFAGSGFEIVVHGKSVPMPEEIDFFNFLGIPMPRPKDRKLS